MKIGITTNSSNFLKKKKLLAIFIIFSLVGCATTAMQTHQKGLESLTGKEYFIPKKPIDRHYIGCAWSKQFGPVEDSAVSDIRVKVEKSFDDMQQNFAYNAGISLGGQAIPEVVNIVGADGTISYQSPIGTSSTTEAAIEGGKARKSELQNVQIISPVSLADIPFEPNIPYITEALRLGNFSLKSETSGKVGISADVITLHGGIKGETKGDTGTTGQGLVVAYKLHMIDPKTYTKQDSGSIALELDKTTDFPAANLFVKAQLRVIEAGANKPLPRNLLWSCDQAEAKSKDIVATWIIELHSKDPKRKSLQIAFPAFPKMEDCRSFSGVIYSRIDPLTDKIVRQKVNITLIQEEVSDSLQPLQWEAKMSIVDESFNIRLVKQ